MITYRTPVLEAWVDYNGHLRDAFYLLIFSYATDAFMAAVGIDPARDQRSLFTLECHLNYLHEVKLGVEVQVCTHIVASDHKRVHLYHSLHVPGSDQPVAASEQMLLHVDLAGPRAVLFDTTVLDKLATFSLHQAALPATAFIGRVINLPQR